MNVEFRIILYYSSASTHTQLCRISASYLYIIIHSKHIYAEDLPRHVTSALPVSLKWLTSQIYLCQAYRKPRWKYSQIDHFKAILIFQGVAHKQSGQNRQISGLFDLTFCARCRFICAEVSSPYLNVMASIPYVWPSKSGFRNNFKHFHSVVKIKCLSVLQYSLNARRAKLRKYQNTIS